MSPVWYLLCFSVSLVWVSAELCSDLDPAACKRMSFLKQNMCSDTCIASVCKRTCNKRPLICYNCVDISNPADCYSTAQCSTTDHKCISATTFTSDFRKVYRLGCAPSTSCGSPVAPCCSTDLCNHNMSFRRRSSEMNSILIEEPRQARQVAHGCADMDNLVCTLLLTSDSQICSDQCVATSICPKMCGKCSTCYECDHVTAAEECNTTRQCDPDHVCYTLETLNFNLEHGYRLGCLHQNVCDEVALRTGNIFGKRAGSVEVSMTGGCCHGDLCNHHRVVATTPKATTTQFSLAPILPPACRYHGCPPGFDSEAGGCYHVGERAMTWQNGKTYCEQRCSRLAEFKSEHEIREVMAGVHLQDKHHIPHYETVFVGAVDPTHTHRWVWNNSKQFISSSLFAAGSNTHGHYCAATNRDVHALVAVDCTSHYIPLCQADSKKL